MDEKILEDQKIVISNISSARERIVSKSHSVLPPSKQSVLLHNEAEKKAAVMKITDFMKQAKRDGDSIAIITSGRNKPSEL